MGTERKKSGASWRFWAGWWAFGVFVLPMLAPLAFWLWALFGLTVYMEDQ